MKKKIVVVEYEVEYAERMVQLIKDGYPRTEVILFHNMEEAYKYICKEAVSLVITAMEMGSKEEDACAGMHFVQRLRKHGKYQFLPVIVVAKTEARKRYMYEEMNCFSYFVKPLDEKRFTEIIFELMECIKEEEQARGFVVRRHNVYYVITAEEIMYAESRGRVLHIHLTNGRKMGMAQKPIEYIMQTAGSSDLIQCARGTVVNRNYIYKFCLKEQKVLMSDGEWKKVGNPYVERMRECIFMNKK